MRAAAAWCRQAAAQLSLFLFKFLDHIRQQLTDRQVLRAGFFALAALDAIRGPAPRRGMHHIVVIIRVPIVINLLGVHHGKQIGDSNVPGAAVGAVAAGRAGDQVLALENLLHLFHRSQLGFVQRPEILHKGDVVLHLLHIAHAGQHHFNARKAGGEADGIAGGAAAVQRVQHSLGVLGQVDQVAALDRLHHDDGLAVPDAHLIALAALHGRVVVIHIVELQLHDLHLGIVGQNLLQHLGTVVEENAHMADLALGLEGEGRLVGAALLIVAVVACTLRMHQVIIKVFHAAGRQLAFKQGADIGLGLKEVAGQLVGQDIAIPGIAAGQAGLQRRFALALNIAVGGIKVVEARLQKSVHHTAGFGGIHRVAVHRQAHAANPKFFFTFSMSKRSFLYPALLLKRGRYPPPVKASAP